MRVAPVALTFKFFHLIIHDSYLATKCVAIWILDDKLNMYEYFNLVFYFMVSYLKYSNIPLLSLWIDSVSKHTQEVILMQHSYNILYEEIIKYLILP